MHAIPKLAGYFCLDGGSIQVDVDGQTVTSTLSFSSLNDSHSGEYECEAHIVTSAIPGSIQRTAAWTLAAQGKTNSNGSWGKRSEPLRIPCDPNVNIVCVYGQGQKVIHLAIKDYIGKSLLRDLVFAALHIDNGYKNLS